MDRWEQPERWYKEAAEELAVGIISASAILGITAIIIAFILTT